MAPCVRRTRTSVDMCLLTAKVMRGQGEETPCVTAAELNEAQGPSILRRGFPCSWISCFLRFQVAVIRRKENTQSRNSLRFFLGRRICSQVVNLPFMGHAQGPRSVCFPNGLNYKCIYFLHFLKLGFYLPTIKIHSIKFSKKWKNWYFPLPL